MKRILKFVIVFATLLTISCSKDEENIVDDLKDETVKFYANNPNTDGLLAEVKISDKNATAFFYGISNDSSEPRDINSISFVPNNTDTITNIILDNNKRPSIVTFNKKNGQKINTIVKYEYLTNDTISYSIYKYDWITHKDSLQFQAKTKDTYSIKTYGARGFTIDANFRSTAVTLVSSLAVAAVVCGTIAVLGPAALGWAIANPALALGGLTFAAGIIANASPNQQIQTTINHNAPTSPTSGTIPNPTGTPQNPVGYGFPISLNASNVVKLGIVNNNPSCNGEPNNFYYLNFTYNDSSNRIKYDLSNIRISWDNGGGCLSPWSNAVNYYFANYPLIKNSSSISFPIAVALSGNSFNVENYKIYFIDETTGNNISNIITFKVERGINYP